MSERGFTVQGARLGIYLNDHLAGATFGVGTARRIAHQHRRSGGGADLERIAEEIAQDRQTLLAIMGSVGVPARPSPPRADEFGHAMRPRGRARVSQPKIEVGVGAHRPLSTTYELVRGSPTS
ncbi:hypothetical protein ACFO3J_32480 [Streptomyces polygonati]|uniref:Uncharacterized protein n=1 Tax=Streptomyces polygonati TaxID=1617087 RepID=A0ABV8HYX1_9ACTN